MSLQLMSWSGTRWWNHLVSDLQISCTSIFHRHSYDFFPIAVTWQGWESIGIVDIENGRHVPCVIVTTSHNRISRHILPHKEGIRQYDSSDTGQFRQREHRCRTPRTSGSVVPVRQHEWLSSLWGVQVLQAWRPLVSLWRPLMSYVTVLYFHWKSP